MINQSFYTLKNAGLFFFNRFRLRNTKYTTIANTTPKKNDDHAYHPNIASTLPLA